MMMRAARLSGLFKHGAGWKSERGSQIVEFALSLPLLVFFVIGIFDFSNALSLKQKLTNAAREGARVAAADPASDLVGYTTAAPASVSDAFQVVDAYLIAERINDCGLVGASPTGPSGLTWTYSANGSGCPGSGIQLTINRGNLVSQTGGQTSGYLVTTMVTVTYPYNWQFSSVTGLFGRSFALPTTITTSAVTFNEN
ncbi:MAG: TadE/TadG family type IV pilus assembly protein [Candidatus Sulfotelmatobacter sp.]